MKNVLIRIAQALVDNPEQVQVNEIESARTVILELRVAKSDLGKIIGKQGKTVSAIRTVLSSAYRGAGKRHKLEILD
jgi:predicted RNA-binding protein YlqC (UPF0109 family)